MDNNIYQFFILFYKRILLFWVNFLVTPKYTTSKQFNIYCGDAGPNI